MHNIIMISEVYCSTNKIAYMKLQFKEIKDQLNLVNNPSLW